MFENADVPKELELFPNKLPPPVADLLLKSPPPLFEVDVLPKSPPPEEDVAVFPKRLPPVELLLPKSPPLVEVEIAAVFPKRLVPEDVPKFEPP